MGNRIEYVLEGTRLRARVLRHWIGGGRNYVSFRELAKHLVSKSAASIGRSKIEEVREDGSFFEIHFCGLEAPIYYPKEYEMESFYIMAGQILFPDSWHCYESEHTEVEKEDIVVDCGASEGLFSFWVADRCRRVYAIEPLPRFVDSMKLTFRGRDNVEILPYALSDKEGEMNIKDSGFGSTIDSQGKGIPIEVTTIDKLFYERGLAVSYLKADLEGYDLLMLQGAEKTVEACRPKIAITTYHEAEHAELISRYLKEINTSYNIRTKGISVGFGSPFMLHAWVE